MEQNKVVDVVAERKAELQRTRDAMIQKRKEEREKELALYNATKEGTNMPTEQIQQVLVEGSKNDLHSQFLAMEAQIKS